MEITDKTMTSDQTAHTARIVSLPGQPERWRVSWLPDQLLRRNQAITAVLLAEFAKLGPLADTWAAELDLTAAEAIERINQPPHELRRFHVLAETCWCEPRTAVDGHREPDGTEPVFAATDADPVDVHGYLKPVA